MTGSSTQTAVNLAEVIEEMFLVLSNKEKEVIVKRFSLDNKPRRTLESIGQQFSVTRERIRQIEKIALSKLKRTVSTTRLNIVNEVADKILAEHGGVLLESKLVAEVLHAIGSESEMDAHIVKLALSINSEVTKTEKTNVYIPFWRLKAVDLPTVSTLISEGIKALKKSGDVLSDAKLVKAVQKVQSDSSAALIVSSMEVDNRVKRLSGEFGLMSWRHINPKSIRDKAYIVLKREGAPLHFVEIAKKIEEAGFDKKVVTTQAVHNELIRYEHFVLVGRGLYGLKEFGYMEGTVADIIEQLLDKNGEMSKKDIMEGVLAQRHVKKGTISLNLQKNAHFVRTGRAVYTLDKTKK